MTARLCLLLLFPAIVSFAPPRKIPAPLRYENDSGDVILIADWDRGASYVFVDIADRDVDCTCEGFCKATRKYGNRYAIGENEVPDMVLRIRKRKVTVIRLNVEICAEKGVYRRVN